jgi:acetylornithine/N-succinyldiaminopimelate aminotransferase
MTDWQELEKKYYMRTFAHIRLPITLVKGKGAYAWDDTGKKYLDFVGGLAVNSLGHAPDVVAKAVAKQAKKIIQTSNIFYTVPQIQLAQILVENSCLQKVFIANSGLEANEGAIKLARRYGALKLNGAFEVITVLNSFHGRSLALTAATGQPKMQAPYYPMPTGFINVEFNNIDAIKAATNPRTCAVMLELIQGETGVNVCDEAYVKTVRQWCDEKGILLILDEIQTGIGRLGTLFGYQLYGIEPDIITLAKGMGSGVPIGAVMAKENASVFVPGDHGSTFGGNPLTCAAAFATMQYIIKNNVAANANESGKLLIEGLEGLKKKYPIVKEVRGRGLLLAIEFKKDIGTDAMMACLNEGLLVNKVKANALRLVPPLIIGKKEVDIAISILDKVIAGFTAE